MFDLSFVGSGTESRRPWTFTVSLLSQGLLLAVAGIATVVASPELPFHQWTAVLLEPPRPPAAAPPPAPQRVVQVTEPEVFRADLVQPTKIPDRVEIIVDEASPAPAIYSGPSVVGSTGEPGGVKNGVVSGFVEGIPSVAPPPPPPPVVEKAQPPTPKSIRVGGDVQAARLIRKVAPIYPPLARQARIQGVVSLRAVIAEDGSIEQLETLSGHPLLIQAAIQAVQQWLYRPTLLNNKPVQVVTQVDVHFKLG